MVDAAVGRNVVNTLVYLDQDGQPMAAVVPDSLPVWADAGGPDILGSLDVAIDGNSATYVSTGAGLATLTVAVVVDGQTLKASVDINSVSS